MPPECSDPHVRRNALSAILWNCASTCISSRVSANPECTPCSWHGVPPPLCSLGRLRAEPGFHLHGPVSIAHGMMLTTGAAMEAFDPDVFRLEANSVPTIGHYLQAAGYATFWKGKWHASDADLIIPGTHNQYSASMRIAVSPTRKRNRCIWRRISAAVLDSPDGSARNHTADCR